MNPALVYADKRHYVNSRFISLPTSTARRSAESVRDAVMAMSNLPPHLRRSLTWD